MNLESLRHHYTRVQEWPFNSDTKTMTVKCSLRYNSEETLFFMKGALEKILPQCSKYFYRGTELPVTARQQQAYQAQATRMGTSGLRGWLNFCVFLIN